MAGHNLLPADRAPILGSDDWLDRFHAGEPAIMEECYRQHFSAVKRSVERVLEGADAETAVHELFCRLLASAEVRSGFSGGSLEAWLVTWARHLAIDYVRRRNRERPSGDLAFAEHGDERTVARMEAHLLIRQFEREILPEKWRATFVARFLEQRSQREAAGLLGIHRTTLAYQELRIRKLLRRFLLQGEEG